MIQMKFSYLKYRITSPDQKLVSYVYRPVIPIKLFSGNNHLKFKALIDAGADKCTFPGWIADRLGFDIYKGEKMIFSGIGGSVLTYLHKTNIKVNELELYLDIYYSHEWDDMPFGLLGQSGFFSHFEVCFNYKEKFIQLKSYS